MEKRNPSGVIENTTFIGLASAIGAAFAADIQSPEWRYVVLIGAPLAGKYAQMIVAELIGDTLGGTIKRTTRVSLLLLVAMLGTGCAGFVGTTDMRAIDPATGAVTAEADCKGVGWSFGQSDVGDGCVGGEAISTPGADLVGKALGAVGAVLKGMGAGLGG